MARLTGRVAVVTGAGEGIGRGIARRFAAEDATVVVAEIDTHSGERCAHELRHDFGAPAPSPSPPMSRTSATSPP